MEMFKHFFKMEKQILEQVCFEDFFPEIFTKNLDEIRDKYILLKTCTDFNNDLIDIFKSLALSIRNDKKRKRILRKQKLLNVIKFVYFILTEEDDDEDPNKSVWLIATDFLLAYLNLTSDSELSLDSNTNKVYLFALERLTKRFNEKRAFPQDLLYNFIEFVSKQKIMMETMKTTIKFLDLFASVHYNMITSLAIYDKNCAVGFLAFVSLLKILKKDHQNPAMNRQIIKCLFLNFEANFEKSTNLTSVQKGILYSNFLLLFRQAKDYFLNDPNSIIYTIITLVRACSNSKTLTMMANQLEFETYKKFAAILIQIAHREYAGEFHDNYQTFCYSLLESPFLPNEVDETVREHLKIKGDILEALLWPLHNNDCKQIEKTVHFLNRVLMLNDMETRMVVKDFLDNHKSYNEAQILGLVYQNCAINWETSKKTMNRYYILLFCNIFKIREKINLLSFKRFSSLMNNADIVDLNKCIKTLISVITKQGCDDGSISYIILNILTKNALSPNLEYVHYLKVLYEVIFKENNEYYLGENIASLMETLDLDLTGLFERMIIQKYINQATIKYLSERVYVNQGIWLVFEKLLPNFPSVPIPEGIFLYFSNKRVGNFLNDPNCKSFFILLSKTIVRRMAFDSDESTFFSQFALFLGEEIGKRRIPLEILPYGLVILRKITDMLQVNYVGIMILYQELEMKIRACMETISNNNDNSWKPGIFPRDIAYYSEINQVFGDKSQFQIFESTVTSLKNGLRFIKDLYKKYPELFDYILKCINKLCSRCEVLVNESAEILKFVLIEGKPKSQFNALCCLYDLALTRTGNYEIVLKHIFKLLSNDSDYIKEGSSQMLFQLIKDDHVIPDEYQVFSIIYNLADKSLKRNANCFTPTILEPNYDKLMEKNFIHLLLFFNKYYNHPNYTVSQSDLEKVEMYCIPFDKRHVIYEYMFAILPWKNSKKIITNLYTVLVEKFYSLNVVYPKNYELLQDIISITFFVLKLEHVRDYPKMENIYKETIKNTLELIKGKAANYENKNINENDVYTKQILSGLLNIFNNLDHNGKYVAEDIFHIILAFYEFDATNLKNIIREEGSQTHFAKSIRKSIEFYEKNLQLFHFEEYCPTVSIEESIDFDIDEFERR